MIEVGLAILIWLAVFVVALALPAVVTFAGGFAWMAWEMWRDRKKDT